MKQLSVKEYKVNVYYDIEEWGREFYGMPEGAILEDREELESECMGFACPDDNRISIFIPKYQKYRELEKTVAHELGHLMEFKAESSDEAERQEEKANHYESFYELVNDVLDIIFDSEQTDFINKIVSSNRDDMNER